MTKKLYLYALLTSPILALYGVSPLYIFNILDFKNVAVNLMVVIVRTLIFWLINILLILYSNTSIKWRWYAMSFLGVFVTGFPLVVLEPVLPFSNIIEKFLVYPIIFTLACNTIILIICNSILAQEKKKQAEVALERIKVQSLEAQKQVLMQQLQPHFLFNTLSILKSLIKTDADVAEDYAVKLSDFLRYSVDSHKAELVSLDKELKFVNDYIELQKVRFEDAFEFVYAIPAEVLSKKIPVFAVQTLIENAFKHNYFTAKKRLTIRVNYQNGQLTVCNNKVSIKLNERSQTGLSNLNKRYELITGKGIEVVETDTDFCVSIHLIEV